MSWRRRSLGLILTAVGVIYMVQALVSGLPEALAVLPDPATVLLMVFIIGVGVLGGSMSWAVLLSPRLELARVRSAFLVSQMLKYAPAGGLLQAAGQVSLSTSGTVSSIRASTAFLTHALVQVVAGAFMSAFVVAHSSAPPLLRALAAVGFLAPVLLSRAWMVRLAGWASRTFKRDLDLHGIPSQAALVRSFLWVLVPLITGGLAFGLALDGASSLGSAVSLIPSFSLAWTAGFLAFPVPAGLGVREAVLTTIVLVPPGAVVAASIVQRTASILAEGLLALFHWRSSITVDSRSRS